MRSSIYLALIITFSVFSSSISLLVNPDYSGFQILRDGVFHRIVLPEYPCLGVKGEPELPHMPVRAAIPTGTRVINVQLVNCRYDTLPSRYWIAPVTPLICSIDQSDNVPNPDPHIYSSSSYFPNNCLELWDSGVIWGLPVLVCWLRPLQWNPSTGEIRALISAELLVSLEDDPAWRPVHARTLWSEENSQNILRAMVFNPEAVSSSGAVIVEPGQLEFGQYVVITVPEYQDYMQELVDWKTAKGIPAEIYTTDWIVSQYPFVDLQQSIRAFLTDCVSEGTDFVLLVGDNDILEARFTYPWSREEFLPSDLYYADNNDTQPGLDNWDSNLNGLWGEWDDNLDWHPDLWVGRASVNSISEAEIFVEKVLIYEHAHNRAVPDSNAFANWETSIGYTTGFLNSGGSWPGSVYAESISSMVPSHWEEYKCYESWGNNSTMITIAMINEGHNHIFHANHGGPDCMYTAYGDIFTVDDIMELQNISNHGAVSIWNSIACSLGAFDTLTSCADAWLNAPDGGGFGCFNARSVFASVSSPICEGFYDAYLNGGFYNLGVAHGLALDGLCPPTGQGAGGIIQGHNLFGDPELPMWISPSGSLLVEHPGGIDNTGSISVTVTDEGGYGVENARVCLQKGHWKTGDVYEVEYTDASGNVSLWVDPHSLGKIKVTVWAHDFEYYSGVITVDSIEYGQGTLEPLFLKIMPNPSPLPVIVFSLVESAFVQLYIFDLYGRLVRIPVEGVLEMGLHEFPVEGLCSGMYFARMRTGEFTLVKSFLVIH